MTLEQEQQSDLMWATKVLNGAGEPDESAEHACWMLSELSVGGCTDVIRKAALSRLQNTTLRASA